MASGKIKGGNTTSAIITKGNVTSGSISSGSQNIGGRSNVPVAGTALYIGQETDTAIVNVDNGNFTISADVKVDNVIANEKEARESKDAQLQRDLDTLAADLSAHELNKNNPHEVTKAQVGLGNVDNTSDLNKPISLETERALRLKQDLITNNNKLDADLVDDSSSNHKFATESQLAQIETNRRDIASHISNIDNPHQVTKYQIGLGSVDNTSDLEKPISTATQQALDTKQNEASVIYQDKVVNSLTVDNNIDYTYAPTISSGVFTFNIPSTVTQGYMSVVTFINADRGVNFNFVNNSSYSLHLICNTIAEPINPVALTLPGRKTIFFRCDGYYIEILIVEE